MVPPEVGSLDVPGELEHASLVKGWQEQPLPRHCSAQRGCAGVHCFWKPGSIRNAGDLH